ncbi:MULTISPECIES: hypothetical protein [Sphingobacterium]|uniref:hypothetical protein n=1 Tax=Sphingobacterium TaxID=28453 RepID=UPI0013D9FFE7|nr:MULTISPECIES: hypothetical protein [unclassified Sphingobacterium]
MKNLIAWIVTSLFLLLSTLSKGANAYELQAEKDTSKEDYFMLPKEKENLQNWGLIKKREKNQLINP